MAENTFPEDLRAAQLRLHRATAELAGLVRSLPWSVEPHEGWPGTEHPHTGRTEGGRPSSPGWREEERAAVDRLRAECLALSEAVAVHPYWAEVAREDVVAARTELKAATRPGAAPAPGVTPAA
ncbi:hypothetical protein NPS70_15700 [Streptomyces sp. C10-9-1]|uniref:hypothetical protein n=1 Tax=Streptomyces sp. C10-9-1 TaxID=1859285 RepID=UPI0021112783|nr:hypothetical protein [Streptomyces sp. C10-9-1]MCQ6554632.1 hypothetical protein [Streptomyces sp. C10-9-1]